MTRSESALDLLIFRAGEARFGLDAAQIAAVLRPEDLEVVEGNEAGETQVRHGGATFPVVGLAAMAWDAELARSQAAKVVLPKGTPPPVGFIIGDPEEMARVEVGSIEALPPLIRAMVQGSGMWAAARHEDGLVILIDLAEVAEAALKRRGSPAGAS